MDGPCAIGRLEGGGPWIGFWRAVDGYSLAVGDGGEVRIAEAPDDLLLALAIVYFEDVLEDPPPSIEATHADLSDLVRSVAGRASDPQGRRLLDEAVDSIDDGLAVDEVIGRLGAARRRTATEQADPLDLLRDRVSALLADGRRT
jgi:hypothetical protein